MKSKVITYVDIYLWYGFNRNLSSSKLSITIKRPWWFYPQIKTYNQKMEGKKFVQYYMFIFSKQLLKCRV